MHALVASTRTPARQANEVQSETLLLGTSLFLALAHNRSFVQQALDGRALSDTSSWLFAATLLVLLVCLHFLLLAPLAWGRLTKPLLALGIVVAAATSHFIQTLGIYLDAGMLRNVLQTDWHESRELLSAALLGHLLLYAALPLALLWPLELRQRSAGRALLTRLSASLLAALVLIAGLWLYFQPLSSLMRNHKELRYLITPANVMWASAANLTALRRAAKQPRQPIGLDARAGPLMAARRMPLASASVVNPAMAGDVKPLLVLMVVGETARHANWGLSGYARQTTPRLAELPVINFAQRSEGQPSVGVKTCGTNTEVSLPCMFAPVGRRDYDGERINRQESLLHLVARAGVAVHWRDNQSGCKGVCEGLPYNEVAALNPPGLCQGGRCLDEGLLFDLNERLAALKRSGGSHLWVMHQLGSHGPSYAKRYPPSFARFAPACNFDDLQRCNREEIVNAYDNTLLYTDHVLASLINKLQAAAATVDTVLIYVSDHGESLGENKLFLHGLPYAIAPDVQTQVPMVMWLSDGAGAAMRLNVDCLRHRASQPTAHDHLFHTLLSLLDVKTALYEPAWDLTQGCRL